MHVQHKGRDPQLQYGGQLFLNIADRRHIMALTCLKGGTECGNN